MSLYLLYTLFSLNDHYIYIYNFFLNNLTSQTSFQNTILSLSLSLSLSVNSPSFSSFSHLSSPVKFSSFAPFFTRKLHKQTKKLHFNTNPRQSKVHLGWMQWQQGRCSGGSNKVDPMTATTVDLTDFHWVCHVGLCWIFHMGFPLDLVFIDFSLDLEWVFRQVWVAVVIVGLR